MGIREDGTMLVLYDRPYAASDGRRRRWKGGYVIICYSISKIFSLPP